MITTKDKAFLKVAAIMAFTSAITTFSLWFFPLLYAAPTNFEEGIALASNGYYLSRQWINFVHIPIALTAYFGLAVLFFTRYPTLSVLGMIWFVIWGIVEMVGIAIILFTVNFTWRAQYQLADIVQRTVLKNNIQAFFSIWDSMFFVLLTAFLIGSCCFALMTWHSKGSDKLLSYLLWLSLPLTALIMLSGYADQGWAGKITQYIYPVLQPVSRTMLGIVIWKNLPK